MLQNRRPVSTQPLGPVTAPDADVAIAGRLVAGDSEALSLLLGRYWRPLVSFAMSRVGSLDAAEDLVQEAFVRVWQHRGSGPTPRHGRTSIEPSAT
ncbi:MAG: hypothetical protein FJ206_05085 [Gemmatimonadetes bacterium]|nr:hypothetical protein [Gemmatimonadota bacterium]